MADPSKSLQTSILICACVSHPPVPTGQFACICLWFTVLLNMTMAAQQTYSLHQEMSVTAWAHIRGPISAHWVGKAVHWIIYGSNHYLSNDSKDFTQSYYMTIYIQQQYLSKQMLSNYFSVHVYSCGICRWFAEALYEFQINFKLQQKYCSFILIF